MDNNEEYFYSLRLGRLSFVLAVGSIVLLFVSPIFAPYTAAALAVIFAILSKGRNDRIPSAAKPGFILGIISLVLNTIFIIIVLSFMYMYISSPSFRDEVLRVLPSGYADTLDSLIQQLRQTMDSLM